MSSDTQRIAVIRYWWSQAQESFASAQRELKARSYTFAINRLYYAAFYAASAALFERNFTFKKHSGVRAIFHREFIKTGLLNQEHGKLYDQLFEDRQDGDYVVFVAFGEDYVEMQLKKCQQLLEEFRPLIKALEE